MFIDGVLSTTLSDVKMKILHNNKWASDYIFNGDFELEDSLGLCCSINNASSVLFKRDILVKANPFDLDFKFLGDWYTYLKVASLSKVAYINKPLNNYRDHSDNVSKKATENLNHLREYFLIYNWIFRNVKVNDKELALDYFDGFTKHSLSVLNNDKRKMYKDLYEINKKLFFHMVWFNIKSKLISVIKN